MTDRDRLIESSPLLEESFCNIQSPTEPIKPTGEEGGYPILLISGPNIKILRLVRLFCFFLIIMMYTVYSANATKLLESVTIMISLNKSTDKTLLYVLPTILNGLPPFLAVVFGFVSDYKHYQRAYLLSYSFVFSGCSSFFLMLCSMLLLVTGQHYEIQQALKALISLSILFHIFGFSIFLPISLGYGLDLLEGTKWEVKYLFFPIYYVVQNLGYFGGVLTYVYFDSKTHWKDSCTANFSLMVCTLLLFVIFRVFRILPLFDQPIEFDVIPFRKAIEIFKNSVKIYLSGQKSPRGHWFIQLSSDAHYGSYPRKQVQMVASFFEINFLFIFIFTLFTATQAMLALFPRQGILLRLPPNTMEVSCPNQSTERMYSLIYINFFTIVVLTPFIEAYFYKIVFFYNSQENLRSFEMKRSFWQEFYRCLRCFDRYWHISDPILKRIFWGSIFGFLSLLFALFVEISRITSLNGDNCTIEFYAENLTFKCSTTSIFAQIPQYVASGLLEIVSYIGCLQFIYYQTNKTYKDQLKGLFFGLYYFYMGLAIMLDDLFYFLFGVISENTGICLTYISSCEDSNSPPLIWISFVLLISLSAIVLLLFACFAHYRHYQLSRIDVEEMCLDEEG